MRSFLVAPLAMCALSLALLAPAAALASGVSPVEATEAQKKQATDHFNAGKQAIEAKNWEKATLELGASLDIVDSPNARLELARALRDSHQPGNAWAEYGRVVEDATKLAAKEPRYARTADAATAERRDLEPQLAFVVVTVAHPPPGAILKVSGRTVPPERWSAPIVAFPGAVDVVLTDASGKELARTVVPVAAGEKTPASLDAQPAPLPSAVASAAAAADKPDVAAKPEDADAMPPSADTGTSVPSNKRALRTYAYVAGGVGLAGMATFAVFGVVSNSAYRDLQSTCPPPSRQCPPDKQSEVSSGRTEQTIANVSVVAGAVGLAVGATLFVLSLQGGSSDTRGTALEIGPAYVGVRGAM
jgi:hypothetical protein